MKLTKRERMASEAFECFISGRCQNYCHICRDIELEAGDIFGNVNACYELTGMALALWAVWPELEGLE